MTYRLKYNKYRYFNLSVQMRKVLIIKCEYSFRTLYNYSSYE